MDWDKVRIFHAVAEAGSFTHAGEALNLSQSAISRQVGALEKSLNVPLFHRHARGLILTEQGEDLYGTAHDLVHRLAMTEARINENRELPRGPLKISTSVGFGSVWLTPRIKEFLEHYPDIAVSIVLDNSDLDLSMREADVAIRLTLPRQPDLIQRHLMEFHHNVYASPDYIKRHGVPNSPEELDEHRIITFGEEHSDDLPQTPALNFIMDAGARPDRPRQPVLQVNNIYGIYRAVQSGLGLGALPDFFEVNSDRLVRILPELQSPATDVYFVYAEELRSSARIAALRDFMVRKVVEFRKDHKKHH